MMTARRAVPASLTTLVTAALLGCGDAGPGLIGPGASAPLFNEGGGAETVTTSERIPVEHAFPACDGAIISLAGEFHIVSHVTTGPNNLQANSHINSSGLTAEYEGVEYRATAATNVNVGLHGTGTVTLIDKYNVIGEGQVPNFNFLVTFHITLSPEGEVKTIVDNFRADCQG